jgi:hypothetical protein
VSGIKQTERRELWRQRIAEQKNSGQTVRAFCREGGIAEHTFYQWRRQLSGTGEQPVRFALVETSKPQQPGLRFELVLGGGERLLIPADAVMLELALGVLRKP